MSALNWKIIGLMVGALGLGVTAGAQATVIYEDLPTANSTFESHHIANGPVLADDFSSSIGGRVTKVEWWGTAAASNYWELTFHTNNNGIPNVDDPAEGGFSQHNPVTAVGDDTDGDGIYHFEALWLPLDVLIQANTSYWFSAANHAGNWLWALADGVPEVGSQSFGAVGSTGALCTTGGPHCGPWVALTDAAPTNLAFRISVPEPASLALLGIGFAGLATMRRRKLS